MENIQSFFNTLQTHIQDESNYYHEEFDKYPSICNLDLDLLITYKNRVGNKLLTLDNANRVIYANLILECIDVCNIQNRVITRFENTDISVDFEYHGHEKEKNENYPTGGGEFTTDRQVTLYKNINEIEVDVSLVWEYCTVFISFIWEAFQSFDIDLRKHITGKEKQLRGNYDFLFKENGYLHVWRNLAEQTDKASKNNNFTAPRQLLAIRTILEELGGVRIVKNGKDEDVSITKMVKFLQFITNREVDREPGGTNFYKYIQDKEHDNRSTYKDDCIFVANQLEMIGLGKLAQKLRNGIEVKNS